MIAYAGRACTTCVRASAPLPALLSMRLTKPHGGWTPVHDVIDFWIGL